MYSVAVERQTRDGVSLDAQKSTSTRPRRSLSRQRIIDEALAMIEEHGTGGLSMRGLANRLGVAPNALYSHVHDKADLIDGLVDELYAGLDPVLDPSDDWSGQLAAVSQAIRDHLLAHPAVVPLALQQPGLGPHGLRLGETIYNVLRPVGFSDQAVVGTVYALLTYILGFVALEAPRADQRTSDEFVRRLRTFYGALPPRQFPNHVELAPLLARFSTDDQFQFGLRTFLTGLIAQQPGRQPSRPEGGVEGVTDGDRADRARVQSSTRHREKRHA
jgi:TetR/AcrR family transcriptional regulator, tetracycline repressor protein